MHADRHTAADGPQIPIVREGRRNCGSERKLGERGLIELIGLTHGSGEYVRMGAQDSRRFANEFVGRKYSSAIRDQMHGAKRVYVRALGVEGRFPEHDHEIPAQLLQAGETLARVDSVESLAGETSRRRVACGFFPLS